MDPVDVDQSSSRAVKKGAALSFVGGPRKNLCKGVSDLVSCANVPEHNNTIAVELTNVMASQLDVLVPPRHDGVLNHIDRGLIIFM